MAAETTFPLSRSTGKLNSEALSHEVRSVYVVRISKTQGQRGDVLEVGLPAWARPKPTRKGGASHTKGCKIDDGENKAIESAKSR